MAIVIRKNKYGVKAYWNGKEEIAELKERKNTYEFILKDGRVITTTNRHLFEVVRKRLKNGR